MPTLFLLAVWGVRQVSRLPSVSSVRVTLGGALAVTLLIRMFPYPAVALRADDRPLYGNPWPYVLGGQSREAHREEYLSSHEEMVHALRDVVPPSRKIVLLNDARSLNLPWVARQAGTMAERPLFWHLAKESWTPNELHKKFRQLGIGAIVENFLVAFRLLTPDHPFAWDERQLRVYRDFALQHLELSWSSNRQDIRNGGFLVYSVTTERRGGCLPTLPGVEPIYSRVAYRFKLAQQAGAPPAEYSRLEKELLRYQKLLPEFGFTAARLGNFYYFRRAPRKAALWYAQALKCHFAHGKLLIRFALSNPNPREAAQLWTRAQALQSEDFQHIWRTENVRWRRQQVWGQGDKAGRSRLDRVD